MKRLGLSVVVVSNLVALLIVSYPILLLTNNKVMMISVRRMFKKLFVASSAATKTGENAEGQIVGKRPKPHIHEHDQHSFNSIRVLFADKFVQFGLSLQHNNQLDFALLSHSAISVGYIGHGRRHVFSQQVS